MNKTENRQNRNSTKR